MAKAQLALSTDTWHTFKIICVGGEFWVYIDNELKMECSEAELYKMKEKAISNFKQGLITEKNYRALYEKIEEYLARVRGQGDHLIQS
jgi:hypothetical protein